MNCPCCLQSVPADLWWAGLQFSASEAQIFANMMARECVTAEEAMIGVMAERQSFGRILGRIRRKIRPRGWTIPDGRKAGLYWLEERKFT